MGSAVKLPEAWSTGAHGSALGPPPPRDESSKGRGGGLQPAPSHRPQTAQMKSEETLPLPSQVEVTVTIIINIITLVSRAMEASVHERSHMHVTRLHLVGKGCVCVFLSVLQEEMSVTQNHHTH